jgi:ribosome-associated protein
MKEDPLILVNTIAQVIYDKKGFNILGLDLRGVSTLTDFVLIGEGSVAKHVSAIAHEIVKKLKSQGINPLYTEGFSEGDWIVLDYHQIMVHLFMPGLRDKYRLEELWREGNIIDLNLNLSPPILK